MATIHKLSYQPKLDARKEKYEVYKDIEGKQERLKAVLNYDGIADNQMHVFLAKIMNISTPVAKRMTVGNHRTILNRGIEICQALNICVTWLYFGRLRVHEDINIQLRTQRIHMQSYLGFSKEITDKMLRFNMAYIGGHSKAKSLMNLVETNKMNYLDAAGAF